MNDIEKLLASISKADYPEARFLTHRNGTFWANGDGEPEGLFASETHDKAFAAALWLDDDWVLWLKEPRDEMIETLAKLADAALPTWNLVYQINGGIHVTDGMGNGGIIAAVADYPNWKEGDRFARWNRAAWEKGAQ